MLKKNIKKRMVNMKIAIDARMINMSGIGTYIKTLMNRGIYEVAIGVESDIKKVDETVETVDFDEKIYSIKEQLHFPKKQLVSKKVDLLHVPHYNVPVFYQGAIAVTIHDLIHLVLPEFLPNKLAYFYARFIIGYAVRKAKVIFTVSENSKADLMKFFKVNPEKIVVTYNAVDSAFVEKDSSSLCYLFDKFNIPKDKKVIMYVGNLKPHKNLIRLLSAYSRMENRQDTCLLLVGKAFDNTELDETIKKLELSNDVIKTGIVQRDELVDLYNLADLFVFPSLYEGFGIPPLEAMACKTPVVCSDNSSLPEVVGDAAITFDPYDENAIKEAMERVLSDEKLANELIKKGFERAKMFAESEIVNKTKETFEKIRI